MDEGSLVQRLYEATEQNYCAVLLDPGHLATRSPVLSNALHELNILRDNYGRREVTETNRPYASIPYIYQVIPYHSPVHAASELTSLCKASVINFGQKTYELAIEGALDDLSGTSNPATEDENTEVTGVLAAHSAKATAKPFNAGPGASSNILERNAELWGMTGSVGGSDTDGVSARNAELWKNSAALGDVEGGWGVSAGAVGSMLEKYLATAMNHAGEVNPAQNFADALSPYEAHAGIDLRQQLGKNRAEEDHSLFDEQYFGDLLKGSQKGGY
ncbi:hypothetical protein HDV00_001698 [Rhizophlyctis rosea]|nr:hypothetical protein HDV00_001698 [Rhizophlyctis rosea]